jgi:hypothetical protein
MSVTVTVGDRPLDEVLDSVRESLRAELNRTEIERDAFEEFATRITDLQSSSEPFAPSAGHKELQDASGAVALQSHPVSEPSATDEFGTIRNAYEETVMSVSFYEAEYGDTYEESIQAEFGPDIATTLTQSNSLSPVAKQVLLAKIEQVRSEREALIKTCEREHASVDEAATVLKPVGEELQAVESISFDDPGFGALEAHRARLLTLKDKCEHAATTRQATIHRHRTEYSLPVDAPDICVYLYEEFETAYPILCLCSDLARRIENYRKQVESALSTRS